MHTTSKEDQIAAFEQSTALVIEGTAGLNAEAFLHKPAPDKWSISEILEHLNISDKSGMIAMLRDGGLPDDATTRESEMRVNTMLAYNGNTWIAPEAATPKGKFATLDEALQAFAKTRQRILQYARENDLRNLAAGFEHPRLGKLSRMQWLQFLTWHANHHFLQIDKIKKSLQEIGKS